MYTTVGIISMCWMKFIEIGLSHLEQSLELFSQFLNSSACAGCLQWGQIIIPLFSSAGSVGNWKQKIHLKSSLLSIPAFGFNLFKLYVFFLVAELWVWVGLWTGFELLWLWLCVLWLFLGGDLTVVRVRVVVLVGVRKVVREVVRFTVPAGVCVVVREVVRFIVLLEESLMVRDLVRFEFFGFENKEANLERRFLFDNSTHHHFNFV